MNKYLKGFLNLVIGGLSFIFGTLASLNILALGFIFFPDLTIRLDTFFKGTPEWWIYFVPGLLPLFALLGIMALAVWVFTRTIYLVKHFDIEKIWKELTKKQRA